MVAKEAFYIYDLSYLQVNVCNILNLRFTNAKKKIGFTCQTIDTGMI